MAVRKTVSHAKISYIQQAASAAAYVLFRSNGVNKREAEGSLTMGNVKKVSARKSVKVMAVLTHSGLNELPERQVSGLGIVRLGSKMKIHSAPRASLPGKVLTEGHQPNAGGPSF